MLKKKLYNINIIAIILDKKDCVMLYSFFVLQFIIVEFNPTINEPKSSKLYFGDFHEGQIPNSSAALQV